MLNCDHLIEITGFHVHTFDFLYPFLSSLHFSLCGKKKIVQMKDMPMDK